MDRLCPEDLERLAKLESPTRNRYFYGKLLTERHFDLEQRYFNRKRWLLNRLTLGSGVICGLHGAAAARGARGCGGRRVARSADSAASPSFRRRAGPSIRPCSPTSAASPPASAQR